MLVKIKGLFGGLPALSRKACLLVVPAMLMAMLTMTAFAVDPVPTIDLASMMTTSVQKIVSDLVAMITAILPVTITLMGFSIGISYAIGFIKKIVKKST